MPKIDFKEIASVALSRAESLVTSWIPGGRREGHEYKVLNPKRSDSKVGSFSINLRTGAWGDFATPDKGGDLIALYAFLHDLKQLAAAKEVAKELGINFDDAISSSKKTPLRIVKTTWMPILPVPDDAGPRPVSHLKRNKPSVVWTYLDENGKVNGYVYRFDTSDGGKVTLPVSFCEDSKTKAREWHWLSFPEPRPLYGLDRLAAHPDLPVLLVEGEKCADAPVVQLEGELVVVTWPSGSNAIAKVDWKPLFGRNIFAWADCDAQREKLTKQEKLDGVDPESKPLLPENKQPGMKAMIGIGEIIAKESPKTKFRIIKIPKPGDKPNGWDVADAVNEDPDPESLKKFIRNVSQPVKKIKKVIANSSRPDYQDFRTFLLHKGRDIFPCAANLDDIFKNDEKWEGVLAFNEFEMKVVKLKKPPFLDGEIGDWEEKDDAETAMWITRKYGFAPSTRMTAEAVEVFAKRYSFNPVQDYLRSLKWDEIDRLDCWSTDFIGVPKTDYSMRVGRWFLMGMVARAMNPGVKFDSCLVLEGEQGKLKSSALRVLGGEWFGDTDLDLHNKDSMSAIRGKWLYEFSELGSLARSETHRQKSFLSRQIDEFRPVYGRREISCPRQLVFGGTTNEWEWNKDPTGGRRFWPIRCESEIDCKALAEVRDQLFAEAYSRYLGKQRFWPTSEEQKLIFDPQQISRTAPDAFVDLLQSFVDGKTNSDLFCLADAANYLKIDASKLTRDIQTRIGSALRQLGCTRKEKRHNSIARWWYSPPQRTREEEGKSEPIPF